MENAGKYEINTQRYRLTHLALKGLLSISPININIRNYHYQGFLGNIFLFNHFTRFETFVPQYILYERERAMCRAVAFNTLFTDKIGDYLRSVGAVPDNLHTLTDFMAREIQWGRKIVLYPEGGMIKDRRVRDREGRLLVYKREGGYRRKPHTGAAVIGIKSRMERDLYLLAKTRKNTRMTDFYRKRFPDELSSIQLEELARSPIGIVPSNITFYPMRREENFFEKMVKKYSDISSKRVLEEIKIEGNIFFKDTDMDIRFGKPLNVRDYLKKGYRFILGSQYLLDSFCSRERGTVASYTSVLPVKGFEFLKSRWIRESAGKLRNAYMNAIYDLTTINLGHLVAHTLFDLHQRHPDGLFGLGYLRALLFMAIAELRRDESIYLHHDLESDAYVNSLLLGDEERTCKILRQFKKAGLLVFKDDLNFTLTKKIDLEGSFDAIRVENPAQVLDNEAHSVPRVIKTLDRFYEESGDDIREHISSFLIKRWIEKHAEEETRFFQGEFEDLNGKERRTESGAPFLLRPSGNPRREYGVLLVHGFSASPAEMKVLGEFLLESGFATLGLRLAGHGTSPAALKDTVWSDWLVDVRLGLYQLSRFCRKTFVIGNSMGALLALVAACETKKPDISGLVCLSPSFKVKDKLLPLVTYADTARRFYEYFGKLNPNLDYYNFNPENPHINYSQVPIQGLYSLYQVIKEAQKYVDRVNVPALFIQDREDPTVDPEVTFSAFDRIQSEDKTLIKTDIKKHVLTLNRAEPLFSDILDFLNRLSETPADDSV